MQTIISSVLVVGLLGLLFGIILAFASKVFHVKVDRKVEEVRAALPGANCGACGFPGCDGLATEIALNGAPVNSCPVGGAPVAAEIAEIMGKVAEETVKEVACVMCQGDNDRAKERFIYDGPNDCRVNASLAGGSKACTYGCLGCGTCQRACGFGAIEMVNGLAVIDKDKCTACRRCVSVCPKKIIEMIPYDQEVIVKCKSQDAGKDVRAKCSVGCIGCRICAKTAPEAFEVVGTLAHVVTEHRHEAHPAVAKCPTKAIYPGLEQKADVTEEKAS